MHTDDAVPFEFAHAHELTEIRKRREAAMLTGHRGTKGSTASRSGDSRPVSESTSDDAPLSTVGLALSGGGIRSACFSLGFLQSLYRRGILRHIDYLSTVSGGGYIGSYLSSFLVSVPGKVEMDPEHPTAGADATKLPFYAPAGAPQPNAILALARRGEKLKQPLRFLSRHFWGLLCINALILSGLVAIVSLAAYLFRILDERDVLPIIGQLGFRDDFSRAFFPTFVLLFFWGGSVMLTAVLRKRQFEIPPITTWSYALLIAVTLMGFAAVLSTGNLDLQRLEYDFGLSKKISDEIRQVAGWLGQLMVLFCGAAILPNLNWRAVLRSGTKPKNRLEGWVFNLASCALLLGVPFLGFYFLSKEDISGWNRTRPQPNAMALGHIRDWTDFGRRLNRPRHLVDLDKSDVLRKDVAPGDVISLWLNDVKLPGYMDKIGPGSRSIASANMQRMDFDQHPIAQCVLLREWNSAEQKKLWFWERWLRFLEWKIGTDDQFEQQLNDSRRLTAWLEAVTNEMNRECLADPSFFECFRTKAAKEVLGTSRSTRSATVPPFLPEKEIPTGMLTDMGSDQRAKMIELIIPRCESTRQQIADYCIADAELGRLLLRSRDPSIISGSVYLWEDVLAALAEKKSLAGLVSRIRSMSGTQFPSTKAELISLDVAHLARKAKNSIDRQNGASKIAPMPLWNWFVEAYDESIATHERLMRDLTLVDIEDRNDYQKLLTAADDRRKIFESLYNRTQALNWNLMRVYFGPELIYPQSEVFAFVVAAHDQEKRLRIFWISAGIFLFLGTCFSVNPTMVHGFYREVLSKIWVHPHVKFGMSIPLSELKTCSKGGPLHLLNGSLNLLGGSRQEARDQLGRFTFSSEFIGSNRTGYCPTDRYQRGCDLPDAMAISGAAVTPSATTSVLVRTLMIVFNMRLGKWIPNPARPPGDASWPSPLRLLWERLSFEPEDRTFLYISDGGHNENTGIGALLARRCRIILAVDTSQDDEYLFPEFRKLLSEAESRYGIRMSMLGEPRKEVRLTDLQPAAFSHLARRHFLVLKIEYPSEQKDRRSAVRSQAGAGSLPAGDTGYLILVKPTLTGDEPEQLLNFRAASDRTAFPNDPTLDQFYEPERFLKYRELGEHTGESLCEDLFTTALAECDRNTPWLSTTWNPPEQFLPDALPEDMFEDPMQVPSEVNDTTLPVFRRFLVSRNEECRALAVIAIKEAYGALNERLKDELVPELILAARHSGDSRHTLATVVDALRDLDSNDPRIKSFLREVANDRTVDDVTRSVAGKPRPPSADE